MGPHVDPRVDLALAERLHVRIMPTLVVSSLVAGVAGPLKSA
jgi:hypothetical protein